MSPNCVDVAIELANEQDVPLILIASRRQIDAAEFGGGYVNGWTTADFSQYVIDRDKRGKIVLARDHGGPWQNESERSQGLSLRRAMESAKLSFERDIEAGFQILHIDTSIDPHSTPSASEALDRVFELLEFCWSYARQERKEVIFEVGTEEQTGSTNTPGELADTLKEIEKFCRRFRLPLPTFVVIQTGTKVMEMRNVGSFDSPVRVADELAAEIQVPMMIDICRKHGILVKEHNADYLSDEALQWHPRLGIHAANVAPEFGVAETRAFLNLLAAHGLHHLVERFVNLAVTSEKWEKWVLPDTKASEMEKALICGHYVFAHDECKQIEMEARGRLANAGIDIKAILKAEIRQCMARYIRAFRLARPV